VTQIERSGENWSLESPRVVAIDVIEPPRDGKKGKRKKKAKKVPFGFGRVLVESKRRKR
jgi:hypothetical protein